MVLPSKTIELIEQIADTLDNWPNVNQKWNNKIIKDKPENLLSKISESLDCILEELQQYMPNIVELVQKKKKKLVRGVGSVYFQGMRDYKSHRRFIISKDDATSLAKTLRHIAEMAKEVALSERPRITKKHTISKEMVQTYVELNLAERQLIVGTDEYRISSEQVWNFLKTLAHNSETGRITPRFYGNDNSKNAVDTLRRKIGKDHLHKVVCFSRGGYFLADAVNLKYGGQMGIRKTRLRRRRD